MANNLEAEYNAPEDVIDYVATGAFTAGQVLQLSGDIVGIPEKTVASGDTVAMRIKGEFRIRNTAITATVGDPLYWDENGSAVDGSTGALSAVGAGDFYVGIASRVLAATDVVAYVLINEKSVTAVEA